MTTIGFCVVNVTKTLLLSCFLEWCDKGDYFVGKLRKSSSIIKVLTEQGTINYFNLS